MPLSNKEQKILDEIEKGLVHLDPEFVKEIDSSALYRNVISSLKIPLSLTGLGFIFMITMLFVNPWLSVIGLVLVFSSSLRLEKSLRIMSKTGFQDISQSIKSTTDS